MKIKVWPNGLGCIVTSGRLAIEVFDHGGVRRLVNDDSLTGSHGTHWATVARASLEEMANAAIESWNKNRSAWRECE